MTIDILGTQRRYAELYRIRLGDRSGKTPRSLAGEIRVTSPNKTVIKLFAEVYGGRPRRWSEQSQFQVYLPITRLPIALLPGQPISQHMELWQGSTCQRRCSGLVMQDGRPCVCGPDLPITDRACKPVTRLTVACPEVPAVGVGLLTTRSVIAAGEFEGQLALARAELERGRAVSAILRVDRLTTPGHSFVVPRLELEGLTWEQAITAGPRAPELDAGDTPALEPGEEE